MASQYSQYIKDESEKMGYIGYDPRHIEAYIRLEHSTLDGLSPAKFKKEIIIGIECIKSDGIENAESCAKSFGL